MASIHSSHSSKKEENKVNETSYSLEAHDVPEDDYYNVGVTNIEIYSEFYNTPMKRIILFSSIFLVCYSYSLDSTLRKTFKTDATNSFSEHSLVSFVNCFSAIVSAIGELFFARSADIFGRTSIFYICLVFYVVGTIIVATSKGISQFAAGYCIYSFGESGIDMVMQLLVSDFSHLNWRLVAGVIPMLPNVINAWASGTIVSDFSDNWQWGIGMFAIIVPVACIPLAVCLFHMRYMAKKNKKNELKRPWHSNNELSWAQFIRETLFWRLDLVGLITLGASLGCILVPFTLTKKAGKKWAKASTIVPEVIGWAVGLPLYIVWEKFYAKYPLTPLRLIRDRGVYAALVAVFLYEFIYVMEANYMVTVLQVAFNNTSAAATRINNSYEFVSVLTAFILGFFVVFIRKTKRLILFGGTLFFVSYGLFIRYRGGHGCYAGSIAALCVFGFANGFIKYPTRTSLQASAGSHKRMAMITALFTAIGSVGKAMAAAIAGAIWSGLMPGALSSRISNSKVAAKAYSSPLTVIKTYGWNSTIRNEMIEAYRYVTKVLYIVAICLCVPLLIASFLLRDRRLENKVAYDSDSDDPSVLDEEKKV
ncbi:hypothetical protein KAFR_0C02660 [Kazachstania africana CBS 2517]|uniref:Major facilitator superfamily (MFS) profile domain-containing protein n=1 Tax=Kazachstania africana (strain ATCC 22294 / BCRC 22015 / CBS 2517 / CECT 1963 / NBRC 1671 / NRRL Y-8276) TaxID=1071382 RepID=H2ASA9_KAZAF|nr:hypothetical protein KAFR_0C02660 [Kazachstania africana CBS 2517]CCF57259.1 hypothetical protein KAFR_0C02660 [Kazachstania africana CBS 2517]